jgi:hypothetical protein
MKTCVHLRYLAQHPHIDLAAVATVHIRKGLGNYRNRLDKCFCNFFTDVSLNEV